MPLRRRGSGAAAVACPLAKASSFSPDCPGGGALRTMQYNAGKKATGKKCSPKSCQDRPGLMEGGSPGQQRVARQRSERRTPRACPRGNPRRRAWAAHPRRAHLTPRARTAPSCRRYTATPRVQPRGRRGHSESPRRRRGGGGALETPVRPARAEPPRSSSSKRHGELVRRAHRPRGDA